MPEVRQQTLVIIVIVVAAALFGVSMLAARSSLGQSQITTQQNEVIYRIQRTAMSMAAPVAHTGNLPHAVVFALPIRDDGKIYTGHVTFTASKPIEIEVLHRYKPDQTPDQVHGTPPTAVINGTTITYSHLTGIVDNNIVTGDIPTASGTFEFTGSGLVFHKRSSEPFTVTYTLDVALRSLTQ
jgi:type II secretory pathway pseudopilin PulG